MKRLSLRRRSVSGVSMDGRMSEGPSTAGRVSNRTDKISLFCLTTCAGKKSSPTKIYKQKNKREKKKNLKGCRTEGNVLAAHHVLVGALAH